MSKISDKVEAASCGVLSILKKPERGICVFSLIKTAASALPTVKR